MKRKSNFSVSEKIHYLSILKNALEKKLKTLEFLREKKRVFRKCNIGIVVERKMGLGLQDQYYELIELVKVQPEKELTREEKLRLALEEHRIKKRRLKEDELESNSEEEDEDESSSA